MLEPMQQTGQVEPLWAGIPLFKGLGRAELDAIAERLDLRRVSAGDVLISQGVWCGELFIIRTGVVEISLESSGGAQRSAMPLRRLVAGECFGEMSLITGALPSATARALADGEVWALSQPDFLQLALAQPELSRNISAILSERLLHTSRERLSAEPAQVIVAVGVPAELASHLAAAVAWLSGQPTLFIDAVAEAAAAPGDGPAFALADLLGGRLRAGEATPGPAGARADALTVVRGAAGAAGPGDERGAGTPDLAAAVSRLDDEYHYFFVALPFDHPDLTPPLLAYATSILVAGRPTELPALRARLAALPLTAESREELSIVLVDAPSTLRPTVGLLELLEEELGAPVRAVLPATPADGLAELVLPLARWLVKQRIGLALGAGGAKGYAHLGAWRSLHRAGVPFDCIAGSSAGAAVGAAIALGYTPDATLAAVQEGVGGIFTPTVPVHGMLSNRGLAAWFRGMGGDRLVEDLTVPFAASAADLTDGGEIVLRRGPLWQVVLASAAIPGIYPPVRVGRHWLVDGGVVNPVPVSVAQLLGADLVIGVDLSEPLAPRQEAGRGRPESWRPPVLPANILRARDIMMSEIRAHTVGESSLLIKPQVKGIALRNFREGIQFVDAGEAAAEAILPRLREQLPWLGQG